MNKQFDVITVGDVFTDIVLSGFTVWPQPGEEAFADALRREAGGGAAITACGLARLGLRTALLAMVGQDSEWLLARLAGCGVAEELIHRSGDDYAGLTVSVSTREDRAFFTYQGTNLALPALLAGNADIRRELTRARHVHIAFPIAPELLVMTAEMLHAAGSTLSLDVGWQADWLQDARNLAALREVDWFMPNDREAAAMTGETEPESMLRAFAAARARGVALKLGAAGSACLLHDEILFAAAVRVDPLDTTGAGDCFDAGFLAAWLAGAAPLACLRAGNCCGALSTRGLGGIETFPTREELAGQSQ